MYFEVDKKLTFRDSFETQETHIPETGPQNNQCLIHHYIASGGPEWYQLSETVE